MFEFKLFIGLLPVMHIGIWRFEAKILRRALSQRMQCATEHYRSRHSGHLKNHSRYETYKHRMIRIGYSIFYYLTGLIHTVITSYCL